MRRSTPPWDRAAETSRRPRASCRWAAVDGDNARPAPVAQINRFAILADEWEPDSDELTPTMKLKRRPIDQKYAPQIDTLNPTKEIR
jgi:long-subunit acyl-CoA synthetase (AMP-forming)